MLDEQEVPAITSHLSLDDTTESKPSRLAANSGIAFSGNKVYGEGFVLSPEKAHELLERNPKNRQIIFPYARSEDLLSRPDQSLGSFVINYGDRSVEEAATFAECFELVVQKVKPYRDKVKRGHTREKWWLHEHDRPELYKTIRTMERVLFHGFTCKYLAFSFVQSDAVFAAPHVVLALSGDDDFAILQSTVHEIWVRRFGSTLETRMRYPASDVFETFPRPSSINQLLNIGNQYYTTRSELMIKSGDGLTETYNRFHNFDDGTPDIQKLRKLHVEMDEKVAVAYGWNDIDLGHDFHETKQGVRFTISESARREVLQRLLKLNYERHAEEEKQGLHKRKGATKKAGAKQKATSKTGKSAPALFDVEEDNA